jgi:hypothetical protein
MNGSDNLIVVKSGDDLHVGLTALLDEMKADYETIEFHWSKLVSDSNYFETKEYPGNTSLLAKWELRAGVRTLIDYKSRMKRLKTLIDHFKPGYDYELTVKETVEILS